MSGWIKISRELPGHWIWQDAERLKWWLDLLILAAWEDKKVMHDTHLFTLKRGQIIASISFLCERWGKSKMTVCKYLQMLENEEMIKREVLYRQTSILTICNYANYQSQVDTIVDRQVDTIVDRVDTIVDRNKEYKEEKEIKNKDNSIPFSHRITSETSSDSEAEQVDVKKFIEFFNSEMDKAGALIPRVRSIAYQRKQMLEARCREYGKEAVMEAVKKAARSDFLNGGGSQGFKADFTWIFRPNKFPRILEGYYDNNSKQPSGNGNNKQDTEDKRRGYDVKASSAKDYKTTF